MQKERTIIIESPELVRLRNNLRLVLRLSVQKRRETLSNESLNFKKIVGVDELKPTTVRKGVVDFHIANHNTLGRIYERFYLNIPHGSITDLDIVVKADGFYSLVFPQPILRDIIIAMNLDSGLFYPEY